MRSEDWKLLSRVISTLEFETTIKNCEHIEINQQGTFRSWHISWRPLKSYVVSDQDPNIKAVLKNYLWIPSAVQSITSCSIHLRKGMCQTSFGVRAGEGHLIWLTQTSKVYLGDQHAELFTHRTQNGSWLKQFLKTGQSCSHGWWIFLDGMSVSESCFVLLYFFVCFLSFMFCA